ncbi:hypothetical protein ACO1O0_003727 [Amphichorda felina]
MASTSALSAPSIESELVELSPTPYSLASAVHARRSEVKIGTWNIAACPGTDKDLAQWFMDGEGLDGELATLSLERGTANEGGSEAGNDGSETAHLPGGKEIGLYVLGLQEVVDLNLTKEYMTRAVYTDNSATEKWQTAIAAAMPPGYQMVVAEQMFGLLLLIYASPEVAPTISNVSTKQIGTGMGGWLANKGAVTTRLVLGETTRMVFVNCHLASGATPANLDRRCSDTKQILSRTEFEPVAYAGVVEDEGEGIGDEDFAFWFGDLNFRLDGLPGEDIRRLLTLHARGEYDLSRSDEPAPLDGEGVIVMRASESDDDTTTDSSLHSRDQGNDSESSLPDPSEFPEDPSQDPSQDPMSLQATLDSLLPHDQLRSVMKDRKAFHDGWREGPITFLPTYKYDVGSVGHFDSSEKQRAPSWCDRILYRTRKDKQAYEKKVAEEEEAKRKDDEMKSRGIEEDEDVLFTYDPDADGDDQPKGTADFAYDEYDEDGDAGAEDVTTKDGFHDRIKLDIYTSHQRITSSDHKPLTSVFTLDYDAVVPELRSVVHAQVAKELDRAENEGRPGITVVSDGGKGHDESSIDFGNVQFLEPKTCCLTIANTGGVPATFAFVEKPGSDDEDSGAVSSEHSWLSTSFSSSDGEEDADSKDGLGKTVTLEPGETIFARVTAQVASVTLVRALNDGSSTIDDVLVLRVEEGRDHFIPVRGTWQPSCFGRSVDELIRVPDGGLRNFVLESSIKGSISYDAGQKFSAPQELFKITTAMEDLAERCIADEAMLGDMTLPKATGWPLDPATWTAPINVQGELAVALVTALDTAKPLLPALSPEIPSPYKLEALSSILLLFLSSLTDGIIPYHLWIKLSSSLPNVTATPGTKLQILDVLSAAPAHNIAFVFLTTALSRIANELTPVMPASEPTHSRLSFRRGNPVADAEEDAARRRRAKERRFAELVAPAVCRSGTGAKDKATKERERTIVEVCIRPEED